MTTETPTRTSTKSQTPRERMIELCMQQLDRIHDTEAGQLVAVALYNNLGVHDPAGLFGFETPTQLGIWAKDRARRAHKHTRRIMETLLKGGHLNNEFSVARAALVLMAYRNL